LDLKPGKRVRRADELFTLTLALSLKGAGVWLLSPLGRGWVRGASDQSIISALKKRPVEGYDWQYHPNPSIIRSIR
jgi:hypothetical protein